jgi:[ribosomal protein S18]-alanine N-acetyltransferase
MPELIEIGPENFQLYEKQIIEIEAASFVSPWSVSAFRAETEKSVSRLWVLISDKTVSGYICFLMVGDEMQLLNLAVHSEKRRQGLGECLLNRMIEKGIAEGIKSIWLEVRPSNMSARNLYKKLGFHEAGIRPNYYPETKENAVVMVLTLPDENNKLLCVQ